MVKANVPEAVTIITNGGGGGNNNNGGGGGQTNRGQIRIQLKPRDQRDASAQQIIARLRPKLEKVAGARLYMQAAQDVRLGGRPTRTQFEFTLQDADLGELNSWAPKILAKMQTLPQLRDVATDQQTQGTTVQLKINRDTASRYGIQPQLIDDTLYDAFGQRQVAQYFTQTNSYFVVLEVLPDLQKDMKTLEQIYLKAADGRPVPLSTLVNADSSGTGPLSVSHQGQFPAVTLSFNLSPGHSLGAAVKAIQQAEKEIGLPETVVPTFSGSAAEFRSSLQSEPFLILAAIIVIYIVLGVLYESYIHPITILSSLPSAGVGALLALILFGYDLGLISLIGIILLIGIVKKNAIMMIDFALDAEREQKLPPEKSIYQACLLRFRPIMMTTMAALLGALPLALEQGTGSELRKPLGLSIVGGLLVSQFLTLYTTPVIYLYMDRLGAWARRWRKAAHLPEPVPEPAAGEAT